ncbi:MAG: type IX secretion system outer membrane channel protein PorV [Bacteroidales bacterium]|jgi:hypothetical protein|nr:type IX secretion system outer membrane channel protein PorV [Bacteroidales bacterium]
MNLKHIIITLGLLLATVLLKAQIGTKQNILSGSNTITTTVPFLLIAPDSRSGALGDAGVATIPDVGSQHYNPSKYAFMDKGQDSGFGLAISYSPWLRHLINDMNLAYVSGYAKINRENVLSASFRYFDLGAIQLRDERGGDMGSRNPHELAVDFGYARLLSDRFSGSVALRFIYSNLAAGMSYDNVKIKAGIAAAADVSFTYLNDDITTFGIPSTIIWGINISNIGNKITYTSNDYRDFIPTNFRTGLSYALRIDDYNRIMLTYDINKLLVPTPVVYYSTRDTLPNGEIVSSGEYIVKEPEGAKDPREISVPAALFTSWADAPGVEFGGSKFREEMAEFTHSIGLEYAYNETFFLRAGYFNENAKKGNRKYVTFGIGLQLSAFGLDVSYLLPVTQNNPLANTFRFTLKFNFNDLSSNKSK